MIEHSILYFIPSHKEFLKIQPGTGDNLSPEDIAAGYTGYVIWNRFKAGDLDIDGELEMECVDGGMMLLNSRIPDQVGDDNKATLQNDSILNSVLEFAYGKDIPKAILLLTD